MLVTLLAIGLTVWQDPDLRADATQQVEIWRPVAADLLVGTPFETWLAPGGVEETFSKNVQAGAQLADASTFTVR